MTEREKASDLWSKYFPTCYFCGSDDFSLTLGRDPLSLGLRDRYFECEKCGARWILGERENKGMAKLEKTSRDPGTLITKGLPLLGKWYPLDSWSPLNKADVPDMPRGRLSMLGTCPQCQNKLDRDTSICQQCGFDVRSPIGTCAKPKSHISIIWHAIGAILAGIFTMVMGYFLTLLAFQPGFGSEIAFYPLRYYCGIAAMVIGGIFIIAGILLPMIRKTQEQRESPTGS